MLFIFFFFFQLCQQSYSSFFPLLSALPQLIRLLLLLPASSFLLSSFLQIHFFFLDTAFMPSARLQLDSSLLFLIFSFIIISSFAAPLMTIAAFTLRFFAAATATPYAMPHGRRQAAADAARR